MAKNDGNIILGAAGLTLAALIIFNSDKKKPQTTKTAFTGSPTDFIKKMLPYAIQAQKSYPKVPIQLILAFAGLESGWGKSAPGFNFFGTKTGSAWTGEKQLIDTTEILPKKTGYNFPKVYSITDSTKYPGKYTWKVADYFRKYPSPTEAFLDFCKFITSGRYANAYTSKDIRTIVTNIWKAGYATAPGYVDAIMKLVDTINKVIANK